MRLRFLFLAALLAFSAGCDPKKEEDPEPVEENEDPEIDPDEPDPDEIKLPGDDIKPADLLTNEIYKHLVIEIVGGSLSNSAMGNFRSFLQQRVNKTNIILRRLTGIPAIKDDSVGLGNLKAYEKEHRKRSVVGDTVYVWVQILNAHSVNKTANFRLGAAYGKSSIAIFGKTLNILTLPDNISRFTLETYILQHEFSHLLGLVDGGISMKTPHEDPDHENHCTNKQCLMYWLAGDNIILVDLLGGQNQGSADVLPILDANCISDLQAAGGK